MFRLHFGLCKQTPQFIRVSQRHHNHCQLHSSSAKPSTRRTPRTTFSIILGVLAGASALATFPPRTRLDSVETGKLDRKNATPLLSIREPFSLRGDSDISDGEIQKRVLEYFNTFPMNKGNHHTTGEIARCWLDLLSRSQAPLVSVLEPIIELAAFQLVQRSWK